MEVLVCIGVVFLVLCVIGAIIDLIGKILKAAIEHIGITILILVAATVGVFVYSVSTSDTLTWEIVFDTIGEFFHKITYQQTIFDTIWVYFLIWNRLHDLLGC